MALNQILLDALVESGFSGDDVDAFESVLSEYFLRVGNDELSLRRSLSDTQRRYNEIGVSVSAAKVVAQKLGLGWPDLEAAPPMPSPAPVIDVGADVSPEVPGFVTRRQCALQLLAMEMITGPEAVAMTRDGTPPELVQVYIDALPEQQTYLAEIDFAAMTYFRSNPLLESIMFASGATPDQVDQFFVDALSR